MGYFGQRGQLPFMLTEEQLLQQQQLLREKQEFDAWRASRAQAKTQSQPQIFSEAEVHVEVNVNSSERSASVARARPQDQVTKQAKAKRAGSASTSRRSPSPKRDYPRGTCTVTRPSQVSPRKAEHTVTPAQDLEAFKADMTSMLSDMLQASFQKFASQFNTNSGGQGNNSNEDTVPKQSFSEPTVEVVSDDDNDNASFKYLTLKTVFLLAMASAGRRSELHALRFDQNYIQFKPKGACVTLYFSPEFMRKNQKPNQVNDPWYIPAIPTGKPEFGAPNCPLRALRYYHRYLTEHPELRKDRRRLFVPIKDNNAGKELSAAPISRWICTTIVDSHAAMPPEDGPVVVPLLPSTSEISAHKLRAYREQDP